MQGLLRLMKSPSPAKENNGLKSISNGTTEKKAEVIPSKPKESAVTSDTKVSNADSPKAHKEAAQTQTTSSGGEIPKQSKRPFPENLNLSNLDDTRILQQTDALDIREQLLDRRDREFERRDRELDRRERELERRERELDRREREFEQERTRASTFVNGLPMTAALMTPTASTPPVAAELSARLEREVAELKTQFQKSLADERKRSETREAQLEARIQRSLSESLDKERQTYYNFMQMSDHEVSEMVEDTVGYLMEKDEDIADRVRFQSLLYLSQEKLASEAGINPDAGSGSLSVAWRLLLGPSLVTQDRLNKAQELFQDRKVSSQTTKVLQNKLAMEYVVEYSSHLRKEGSESGEQSFAPGRIARSAYLETAKRQSERSGLNYESLVTLVDYISPSS
ncbi:hypothetical protein CPB83DRAFT_851387 [Crepidotus variabilis]|uniref:Uncharacterized protein n=1 Tax=Crepidotus variabilis TaxID=179855 RepID=A0A9P6EJI2_9AGAR|nr:hypothetical protein CPB83DRAFT_851387 [Crepidotus variabilis]